MSRRCKVLIVAGGTGGHVFPALAVAKQLIEDGVSVEWLGTNRGLEGEVCSRENIPFHVVSVSGLRNKSWVRFLIAPFQLMFALLHSMIIILKFHPTAVLAMGGYVSGPAGIAAWLLRKRLVLHEQNSVMGATNRILSRFADKILTGFPRVMGLPKKVSSKTLYVGNPVRDELLTIAAPADRFKNREEGSLHLLVMGGSQGAVAFNHIIPEALSTLSATVNVLHIAGRGKVEQAKQAYDQYQSKARIEPFLHDMRAAYEWADLMICRAGALSIAEITAVGVPAILVPYPLAVDDHQTVNARFLADLRGAILLSQADFEPRLMGTLLSELMTNRLRLLNMATIARGERRSDSVEQICKVLCNG